MAINRSMRMATAPGFANLRDLPWAQGPSSRPKGRTKGMRHARTKFKAG